MQFVTSIKTEVNRSGSKYIFDLKIILFFQIKVTQDEIKSMCHSSTHLDGIDALWDEINTKIRIGELKVASLSNMVI
jgi:hypothetical protein